MTALSNIRLRELKNAADDRASDRSQEWSVIRDAADTATALAELIDFREKLAAMIREDAQ